MSPMKVLANLIIFLGTFQGDALEPGEIGDFCKWEPFEAKCRPEEAIIMLGARYGRMKLGRCVKQDLGELGCHADVTELMDDMCSGRQSCSVVVPNPDLDRHKTCSSELTSYLEASYTCKRVILGDIARCRSNSPFPVSSSHGVLLSRTTYETGCGSISSPWLLRADPGQKFNISLWNFDRKHLIRYPKSCLKVALISDGEDGEPSVICVMTQVRHQNVFVSKKDSLLLRLAPFTNQQTKTPNNFLFEFQAIGCANMPPPETGAWTRRVGRVTSIGCYGNDDVLWNVECVETKWVGTVGRCDAAKTNFTSSSRMDNLKLTSVMSLLIIISISFLIGLVVLIGGLFWMQRKRRIMRRRSSLQETAYFNKSGENKAVLGKSISQAGTQGVELYSKKHLTSQHFPPSFPMSFDPTGVCSAYSVDSVDLINSALNSTCTIHSSYNADNREVCDPALCRYHCGLDNVVGGLGSETRLKFSVNRNELNEYDSINDSSRKADIVAQKQQQQQQQQFVSTSSNKSGEMEGHSAKDGEGCALMPPFLSQIKQADTEIFRQHM